MTPSPIDDSFRRTKGAKGVNISGVPWPNPGSHPLLELDSNEFQNIVERSQISCIPFSSPLDAPPSRSNFFHFHGVVSPTSGKYWICHWCHLRLATHWSFSEIEQNFHWIQRIQGIWKSLKHEFGLNLKILSLQVSCWHPGLLQKRWLCGRFEPFYCNDQYFCHSNSVKHLGKTPLKLMMCYYSRLWQWSTMIVM